MTTSNIPAENLIEQLRAEKTPATILRGVISELTEALQQAFLSGLPVEQLMQARADCIDRVLVTTWAFLNLDQSNYALIAVGGYGRGKLHPHSDIDILVLRDEHEAPSDNLQSFLTLLWDIKLEIGHSVRTLEECIQLATEDVSVLTSLTEARLICGDKAKIEQMQAAISPDKMWDFKTYYGAKWQEQVARHARYGDTEYSLEPNLKDGPGGLRDIHTIAWLALRQFGTNDITELQHLGVLNEGEAKRINECYHYLNTVRWSLHMLAGREEDRLLFDHQRQLAADAGLVDNDKQLAVEQYMQDYYQSSMAMSNLNELVMQAFEESYWDAFSQAVPLPFNERFQIRDRHLEAIHDNIFTEQPSAILETFVILAENADIIGVTAACSRGIREARDLIDASFREKASNKALFLRLLRAPHKLATQLKRMNQQGILARYLPRWGAIVGKMQHDLFHIYTVDAHTLQLVNNLRRFSYEGGLDKFPLATEVVGLLPKLELLYIAGLFHDIAKGRGGDHSELGTVDAREFCEQHGFNKHDTDLVVWLVRSHLLMSSTSQRKDISDPDVVREFALIVGNQNYLNYLFALTVADINATNPNLWTSWRASLLRQLYNETRRALRQGLEKHANREQWIETTRRLALEILLQNNYSEKEIVQTWTQANDEYFLHETAADIAWHTEAIINHTNGVLVLTKDTDNRRFEGATQIFIYTNDTQRLFSRVTHSLAQLNLNIQDAHIYNDSSGYCLDTYIVLDENNEPIAPEQHFNLREILQKNLSDPSFGTQSSTKRVSRTLKHFSYPTQCRYHNDVEKSHTIIEVISPNRAGLLATVADCFRRYKLDLVAAKISTLGERVEDLFFVVDEQSNSINDTTLLDTLCNEVRTLLDDHNNQ